MVSTLQAWSVPSQDDSIVHLANIPQAVLRVWVVCNEYQVDTHNLIDFRLYTITFSREMSMERQ